MPNDLPPPSGVGSRPNDSLAGIEVTADFQRFRQIDDIFSRAFHDPAVRSKQTEAFFASYRVEGAPRRGEGFTQKDFALRNAAWALSDMVSNRSADDGRREGFQAPMVSDTPIAPTRVDVADPAVMTAEIKTIAKLFGADLAAVTDYDDRWTYSSRVDTRDFSEAPVDLPAGITSVIVLGHG
ncbi:MAG: reductive dehalogenase, partial [Gammaproteobacteria bacterium]|nr:reductive dehalogenase [Gammaproteobacteria bacterium]